jgi:hypothetical protein
MMTSLLIGMSLAIGQGDPPRSEAISGGTTTPAARIPIKVKVRPAKKWSPESAVIQAVLKGSTEAQEDATPEPIKAPVEGNGSSNSTTNGNDNGNGKTKEEEQLTGLFPCRLFQAYCNEFKPKSDSNGDEEPAPRRSLPAPLQSPPFPSGEWQGYPLVGVPPDSSVYPLMKAIYAGPWGEEIKESRIKAYGWINASGNWSTAKNSNTPDSYWIVPNRLELDQFVFRLERQVDSVQTDHIDWGFRATALYGMDYRYMTAGGWFSDQLLKHNALYGWDPTELYFDTYLPGVAQGMIFRIGRWIACPDIETQFAPDNYMGTHSILFTFDTYTQTGIWTTIKLSDQWTIQGGLNAGNDMAPWYKGAVPCGTVGVRWTSASNNDSVYFMYNQLDNAHFRHFQQYGQPLGHDNFNYPVITWQHKFNDCVHTKQEAYYMYQYNAELGGTPSAGPLKPFGGGGGDGVLLPGLSQAYGTVNYTMFKLSKQDFFTVRNEVWRDERGMRSGFPGTYTSHAVGLTHNFNSVLQMRPEIGYYRNWHEPAFDLGTRHGIWLYGLDMTLRF